MDRSVSEPEPGPGSHLNDQLLVKYVGGGGGGVLLQG